MYLLLYNRNANSLSANILVVTAVSCSDVGKSNTTLFSCRFLLTDQGSGYYQHKVEFILSCDLSPAFAFHCIHSNGSLML